MRKLIRKIKLYFEGQKVWDAKMSEPLIARIVSTPKATAK